MKPTPTGNPGNILLSAALLNYNGSDIGFASNVLVKLMHEVADAHTDQMGKTVVNKFYVGDKIEVDAELDEATALALKHAFPYASLVTSGGASRITWGTNIGGDYFSIAKPLIVSPTVDDTNYTGRNFKFWKATPIGNSEFSFKPANQTKLKVTFAVFPDLNQNMGELLGYFGDIAAGTLVHATAAAAVAGGGNTGNGTVSGEVANDNFTKTETWTLTCIIPGATGVFTVVGSVTGARGNATVGSTYYSNSLTPSNSELSFLINDGGTHFAVNDTFTIATTAKNYT